MDSDMIFPSYSFYNLGFSLLNFWCMVS